VVFNANGGTGRVVGVEVLAKLRPVGRFSGWVAYTLSKADRRDTPQSDWRIYEYDQTHVLTALGNVDLGRGYSVGSRFRYATGVPYTPCLGGSYAADSGVYGCVSGAPYSARIPAFHQLDARVEKRWAFSEWSLTAYLDVQNVYNHQNPEAVMYSYDKSILKYQTGLPILPIVGLRGEL
jgi:outer membrane receptor protein involved in Fe transport